MSRGARRARTVTAALALGCLTTAVVSSCGSSARSGSDHRPRRTTTTTAASTTTTSVPATSSSAATTTAPGTLRTPDTLADGTFPSVTRPPNDGSLANVHVKLTTVAHANAPMALVARPGHPDELFLAERAGLVRLVTIEAATGALTIHQGSLLDLTAQITTDGEKGLLGLAFSRDGNTLYVSYTVRDGDSRIVEVPVSDAPNGPTLGTPETLLGVDQMGTDIHKGGDLAVDAKGYLYIGLGDGGPEDDPDSHAQNPDLLLGKILRIDPTHPTANRPYSIPPDNPDASNGTARSEIWFSGLRNPWRFSIDPASGDLWIGDVGQNKLEEIDRLPAGDISAGANLGWSGYEGTELFVRDRVKGPTVPPIFEISHQSGACAVTGGVVYRGHAIPSLVGAYLYSDLCRSGVDALRATTPADGIGHVTAYRALPATAGASQVISFGTDARGEVYLLSLDGTIRRLDPAS